MQPVAVFDTNILISAALLPGRKPFQCLDLASQRRVQSITAEEILREFESRLQIKCEYTPQVAKEKANQVRSYSLIVPLSGAVHAVPLDRSDNKIIECALVGRATHIVTGDKRHLLPMKSYQGVAIVTAAEFLALVSTG